MATRDTYPEESPPGKPHIGLQALLGGGVPGNHRLTATTGMVLLLLLAFEGLTVLSVKGMFPLHAFVGLLLIPPIGLKLCSTGYRFFRYYTGNPSYRAAGPPRFIPRVIGPILIVFTIGLFGTGVALLFLGPQSDHPWRQLHTVFFLFWFFVMTVHVLTYTLQAATRARADIESLRSQRTGLPGALTRESIVAGSLLLGLAIAIAGIPWDAAWLHWFSAVGQNG